MAQLSPLFTNIELYRYEDALVVTEVNPLVEYILSGWAQIPLGRKTEQFRQFVASEFESQGSIFHITKDSGLFVSVLMESEK
jgi:hypothetical protein